MINSSVKCFVSLFLLIVTLFALSGCSTKSESKADETGATNLAVVIAVRSNVGAFSLDSESLTSMLNQVSATHGVVTMIRSDGDPEVFFQAVIPEPKQAGLSKNKLQSITDQYVSELKSNLASEEAKAQVAQADPLAAIDLAGKALSDCEGEKVIIVCDNGLGTTNYLDFAASPELLEADPDTVVEALKEACALPAVDGCEIQWSFLGEVAPPQEPLNKEQIARLKALWKAVLEAGGAKDVNFDSSDFALHQAFTGLPPVSVVDADPSKLNVVIRTTVLDNASVQFKGDTAEPVNEEMAISAVSDIAQQLLAHPDCRVCIAGCTAGGKPEDFCQKLSEDRAKYVRDLICEQYGVPQDQITCVGLGFRDPWHIDDLDASGHQIEDLAAKNRKVIIMDTNSADAALLGDAS